MRTNYVMIDYENVQPASLGVLDQPHVRVFVFVGANQTRVLTGVAIALQRLGDRGHYVQASGNGKNALDFHIAFYIGELAALDPDGYFHIVSKDAGFDPLVTHLKTRNIFSMRSKAITDLPFVKIAAARSETDRVQVVTDNLRIRGTSRPRTLKTLSTTITALFQNALSAEDLARLLEALQAKGVVTVTDNKVTYSLPT